MRVRLLFPFDSKTKKVSNEMIQDIADIILLKLWTVYRQTLVIDIWMLS